MLLFGSTLFAGAGAGIVTAAGDASAQALSTAKPTALLLVGGDALAAGQMQADGLRSAVSSGQANVLAMASGQAKAFLYSEGVANCVSLAAGAAHADFYGNASALGDSSVSAWVRRRMRVYPLPAQAEASGEGEAVSYIYGHGGIATGIARALGTTYAVGFGRAFGEASISSDPTRIIGVRQHADALALATAAGLNLASAQGSGAALADLAGDSSVRRGGILYHEVFGASLAEGFAQLNTVSIYQPQRADAYAALDAWVVQIRGCRGVAMAVADMAGDGLLIHTGVSGAVGGAMAQAGGWCRRWVQAAGAAGAESIVDGWPSFRPLGVGSPAQAEAQARSSAVAMVLYGQTARAEALGQATGIRKRSIEPVAVEGEALANGFNQVNDLTKAPIDRTVVLAAQERLLIMAAEIRLMQVT